ncbi:SMI1/KNR4 family protein [Erwinia sp. P7711]|uniref:SMI1/KNR4 family protein n=1 Tax=Erwinia sp. P7711 TaxID=3141451 RepID=UPI00318DB022
MSIDNVRKAISIINQHQEEADFEGVKEESLIALAEKILDVEFPDSYRFFLKNLGCGDIAGQEFYGVIKADFINSGIPDAIWLTIKERQESNLPENYVVISSTGDGDYVVLDCSNDGKNKVLLWAPGIKVQKTAFKPYYDDFGDFFYDQIATTLN